MTATGDLPLDERLTRMETKIDWLVENVVILKVKAGIYGAVCGAIVGGLIAKVL